MSPRAFRTAESLRQEKLTREMIPGFLRARGWTIDSDRRERSGQTIAARLPDGRAVVMRVKLCWRRGTSGRTRARRATYSATQLMARIHGSDWVGSIERKMVQEKSRGSTHLLIVQRDGSAITSAALLPIDSVTPIWIRQRDLSHQLAQAGKLGRRTKNHAMNGKSPTLWLQDDRGGEAVADALWSHPGVVDLFSTGSEDSVPPLPEEVTPAAQYSEGACRRILVNAYERDAAARRACIDHHGTSCSICGFNFGSAYGPDAEGHIHVHHLRPLSAIGSSYQVDPIVDLRPVCANCHAVIHLGGRCRSIEDVRSMLIASQDAA